jgi:hypothetical protein
MPDLWMDVDVALAEVPVNIFPLTDDTDMKTREESVVYNQAGMDLVWNFVTAAGAFTQTAVTPTTAGVHDWTNQGNGMYTLEIPASSGTINNDTEGFGWFTGFATGILPWRGPTIGFRAAGLNALLIEDAYSATRGLAGTALPNAAAEAAGGLYTRGTGAGQINQDANGRVDVNIEAISADAPSAANLEADYDGTGYNKANSTIGTTTTNTDMRGTDSAYTGTPPTAVQIRTEIDSNSTQLAAILADVTGLDGATPNSLADALLNRDMSAVADTNARSPLNAMRLLRNKYSIAATTLTVTKEDDTTSAWTATITTDATADPITGSDPA